LEAPTGYFSVSGSFVESVDMARFLTALILLAQVVNGAPAFDLLVDCLIRAKVPQYIPGSERFERNIVPYNLRFNFTPVAFTVPTSVPQIQTAVRCASKYGVKVNPKSGGHSYAAHSLGGEDGHLVVDLKYLNKIDLDKTTNIATVGPGARLGNLALGLYNQGKRAIAHGVCKFVDGAALEYLSNLPNELLSSVTEL